GFAKNQDVEAVVLDIDVEKERISLGIKQLESDPMEGISKLKRGDTATCTVTAVNDGGLEVSVGESEFSAFIRRSDLSRDREDQRPERFAVGDKLDAMITNFDAKSRRIGLSIKALEIAEEKEAVAQYGSVSSGASLGDILGEALNKSTDAEPEAEAAPAEEVVAEEVVEEAPTEEVAEEPTSDETPEAEAAENATDESADESGDDSA
ncbi:MAG TPA: 30S ribosomal protein S1, partial [Rhodobiaceae bacterium]|nr:30S ribosomal protein S1 [Rhodobiaceae bacterium]